MTPQSFPQSHRLKKPAEFERVFQRKASAADGVLIVYLAESDLPHPRLGVSVSKKVGNAVRRNRFKRLFREAYRLSRIDFPNVDLIVIPKPCPKDVWPTLEQVKASLVKLVRQAASKMRPKPKPEATPCVNSSP